MALYNVKISNRYGAIDYIYDNTKQQPKDFSLYQIDNITSKLKSKQYFFDWIDDNKKINNYEINSAWLVKKNDQNAKRKLIYNDSFVEYISACALEKKSSSIDYNYLEEYINYIKELALEEEYFNLMKKSYYIPQKLRLELENYNRVKTTQNISDKLRLELYDIENKINQYLCQYSTFRQVRLWENECMYEFEQINQSNPEYYNARINQNDTSNIIEQKKQLGPEDLISDKILKEYYIKYDGDIDLIVEILGESYLDDISDEDQKLIGYDNFKRRR